MCVPFHHWAIGMSGRLNIWLELERAMFIGWKELAHDAIGAPSANDGVLTVSTGDGLVSENGEEKHEAHAAAWAGGVMVDTPWRCLCFGLRPHTMYSVRLRRTIAHLSHSFWSDERIFMATTTADAREATEREGGEKGSRRGRGRRAWGGGGEDGRSGK